jgi:hypothetical protein
LSFTQPLTATEHPTPGAAAAATPTEKPIARPASEFFFAVPAGNATLEFPLPGSIPDEHIQIPVGRQTPPALSVPVITEPEVFESEIMASVLCPAPISEWTESQESALAEFIDWPSIASEWISSGEIEELIKPKMQPAGALPLGLFSPTASVPTPAPFSSGELSAIPPLERQNFWLNVNAELVIYGATAPDAKVTIAGRQIRLRQDGTFSYRFALPDGSYPLPITAVSQQGDLRQAELDFYRGTSYSGEVGAQPQDPALKPPLPQNVS